MFEKFPIACTAGRQRELDIRRTVEIHGLKISQAKERGCVGAVSALTKIYDSAGPIILGQAIRTIRDAFGDDPLAFDGYLLQGLGLVFNRYNGLANEKELVQLLAHVQHGSRGLLRRAEAQRERTGNQKVQCVAAAIVELHNKGTRSHTKRLPSWWKSAEAAQ